jgi:ABC-2 type transport system permease protein
MIEGSEAFEMQDRVPDRSDSEIASPSFPAASSPVSSSARMDLWRVARLDVSEALRARWFALYSILFGGLIALLFVFGLTESQILGFLGLSRLLVTYIQICMAILPIFILITTVRSLAGDREAGVFEYLLSLPVSLAGWFWGKMIGRFAVIFAPVFLAMAAAAGWAVFQEIPVPWSLFVLYTALLAALSWCFLGLAMLISTIARSTDVAQGTAFFVWLSMILFLDIILLGLIVQQHVQPEIAISVALANPLQVFRTAAMMLFDPTMVLLGPSAFVILDTFGTQGYIAYALAYPVVLGSLSAALGFVIFRRSDLP